MRCDLHVHTIYSGMCTVPFLRTICRESYSPPEAVYERLKRVGMTLVTLTDHDSIEGCERLRQRDDFFVSEEVTCRMPSGTEMHVGVYHITERQHLEIQRRRNDLPRLVCYLDEQRLFFSVKHVFSSLTGRRGFDDFAWFADAFPAFETLNGHAPARNNLQAKRWARRARKVSIGGSDAHTLWSAGTAYTEVPTARTKHEFLEGLRQGRARVLGESGTYWKLTREVFLIIAAMIAERPAKSMLAPLALGIPIVTLVNYLQERKFVRKWARELATARRIPEGVRSRRILPGSGEAVA